MRVCMSMGDPAGIGPELVLKAIISGHLQCDVLVAGDLFVLNYCKRTLGLTIPIRKVTLEDDLDPKSVNVLDLGCIDHDFSRGVVSAENGRAALRYVEEAVGLALNSRVDAIVTCPVNKEAVRLSRPDFSGHTGLIAKMCGFDSSTMMLASERLIVTHVSTHVSMLQALNLPSIQRIAAVIRVTDNATRKLRGKAKIAVAGLNPHAGENGAFGQEEKSLIAPAIKLAQQEGIDVQGPFPPDTVFLRTLQGEFDAVVCMYHDQGHVPIKLIAFDNAVNVTLGLPIIRTSVDHGTAFDIAYKGVASPVSLIQACALAGALSKAASR